ncbi:serine hydrolase domain-containing protein [Aestuariivita boseongensis]|uniref:serine hydrolase domain-containing protein n=1 Tax=Aestuariivita boseongensis TaxID=1470562 RepID=UPI0006808343|nr:serine hydrolase [Aestuariivita boseongensis]
MDIQQGFPPPEGKRATLANWRTSPFNHWAFHHVREIVPSARVANDAANIWHLPEGEVDLGAADLGQAISGVSTDALVILHKGRIVHETYRNGMTACDPHILMSVSKSMLGLVAGSLVDRGEVDVNAPVTEYLPELTGTAYDGATVRQALDMQVGVLFDEDYTATTGPIIEYRKAANWNPLEPGESAMDLRSFQSLLTERDGDHGDRFHYVSPVTDMLAWLFERASGVRFADLLSERLLKPLGAEQPGDLTVDRIGGARAAGGFCITARDLARVGQMLLQDGARDGRQVLPEAWVRDIWAGGDPAAWAKGDFADRFPEPGRSYRAKWYHVPGEGGPMIHGMGIHGQYLFACAETQTVVAWFSSNNDPTSDAVGAHVFAAVARIRDCLR